MHFLYPSFLFALFLLVIPVLIHLFNFRRYQKVYFSNVQFLKDIHEQQSSRRNLKEQMILASRMLALAFLVLAFSRPYLSGQNPANSGKQQEVSIFVDNSYSMQTLNRDGSLLDEAKRRAKEIAAAYGINDRFQLLTQDFEGKHQRLLSREEFNDAVDAVKISPQSRSLQQIVDRQQSLLQLQKRGKGAVFVISDFQKNMTGEKPLKVDSGPVISFIQLKAGNLPNVAVDSVVLLNGVHRPGENEKLVVRLHNYADEKAQAIPLKLTINGLQKALGSYTLNARSVQYDTLSFSGLQAGWQRVQLSLQDNPVNFDNQFYFTFKVRQRLPVLLVNGGTPNIYLAAVFATDLFFEVTQTPDGNVNYASLNSYPLVVLSDVNAISTGLAQQVRTYVAKGGTLLVFPSANADLKNYQAFLQPIHAAFPEKLLTDSTKVTEINLHNPVFKNIFDNFPKSPDLPLVKKHYQLSAVTGGKAEDLMGMPGKQPFLKSFNSGRGKVYMAAVDLTDGFSNLQKHALFVPVLFRIALLGGHDQPLFYTLGRDETLEIPTVETDARQVLKLIKGNINIIPDARQQEGSTLLFVADQLRETGIYDLKKVDSTVSVLAFNDSRSESDLSYLNSDDLHRLLPRAELITGSKNAPLVGVFAGANFGLQLWKLCIILSLIFLAAEIALIRFYKTTIDRKTQPA